MPRIFPTYIFTGNDEHLKKEAVEKLKKALLEGKSGEAFGFNVYDADKCDIGEVIGTLRSAAFISGKRLVLIRNIDAASFDAQKAVAEYVKNPSKDSCLVLDFAKTEAKSPVYKEIRKHAREVSFNFPTGDQVTGWIQKEFKSKGKIIRYDAANLLKEIKKDDMSALRTEIDKLSTYVGTRAAISVEDVEKLVGSSVSRGVFDFVNALSSKDAKKALAIANELLRSKKAIPEILGMVGWQFRRIKKAQRLIKKGNFARVPASNSDIPSFFMQRFTREIRSFTERELDRNIDYLLEADRSIKSGYAKPQDALELLIMKICSGKR